MICERKTGWDIFWDYFWEYLMGVIVAFIVCFAFIGMFFYMVTIELAPWIWKEFRKWAAR